MFEKTNNDDTSNDVTLKRYVERRQMTHIETIRRTMSNDDKMTSRLTTSNDDVTSGAVRRLID